MRKRKRFLLLLISLIFASGVYFLTTSLPPDKNITMYNFQFSPIPLLLAGICLFILFLMAFILKNTRRALFLSLFVLGFLLLNFYHLTQIFFLVLLASLFIMLELFFSYRK
ncbi:hypothetical protein M1349_05820 [Patescibacteria group bacterium]|nr:hypothetical protein [Patescibacteria group bacterium]